jgi:hypothetical protein
MRRSDLQPVFIENNAYEQIANWLRPLPDGSLPNLKVRASFFKASLHFAEQPPSTSPRLLRPRILLLVVSAPPALRQPLLAQKIRNELIKLLCDFPSLPEGAEGEEMLKGSQIGRICKTLMLHKEETPANKAKLGQLIERWTRVIFRKADNIAKLGPEEKRQIFEAKAREVARRRTTEAVKEDRQLELRPGKWLINSFVLWQLSRACLSTPLLPHHTRFPATHGPGHSQARPLISSPLFAPSTYVLGDPGFITRARVPQQAGRLFVSRPVSKVKNPIEDIDAKVGRLIAAGGAARQTLVSVRSDSIMFPFALLRC